MDVVVADLAADAARIDLLHLPAGLARLVQSAWQSEGGLTGLATVVLGPGRQQVAAAVDAAAEGDFRGAAAAGVKALAVGVSTGIAVGELGTAAVGAVQTVHSSPAASGVRSPRAANAGQRENALERSKGADGVERCVYCATPLDPNLALTEARVRESPCLKAPTCLSSLHLKFAFRIFENGD